MTPMQLRKTKLAINGGKPIRRKSWPSYAVGDSLIDKSQIAAAKATLQSKRYFRYDNRPYTKTATGKFENALRDYFQVKHVLAVSTGTAAITLGLLAAEVPEGSVVACPGFTFAATPSAIMLAKCKPLLIECDENFHIDLADLRRKYTPEMKAIVPVHMRGMGEDMPALMEFAREKNLLVIEDAAAACGVSLHGKKLGTFGDVGAFSTQAGKFINTGEGGFIITNNDAIFEKALVHAGSYVPGFYSHFSEDMSSSTVPFEYPLYNFRFDEIRAALGYSQVAKLDKILAKQRAVYDWVEERLRKFPAISLRETPFPDSVSGYGLIFRIPGVTVEVASWVAKALCAEGITAKSFGDPHKLNHRSFWNWRFLFNDTPAAEIQQQLPNSYNFLSEAIDIPLFANLTRGDQRDLVNAIDKVLMHLSDFS